MAKIKLEHISKSFGKAEVLRDVSLELEEGKIYGFIGYNGSGKTVLLKCICGLLLPEKGTVYVQEEPLGDGMLKDAGIIIENPAFLSGKTGRKNLELLYMLNHKRDKAYIEQVMRKVGLDPDSPKVVKNYSLGMRQRLALAQAIMENPGILILDEPMNGLDKKGVQEVREMLLDFKAQGKLILLASHSREDIDILCDEVYDVEDGCVKHLT